MISRQGDRMTKKWQNVRDLLDSGVRDLAPAEVERQEFDMEHGFTEEAHSDARREAVLKRDAHRSRRWVGPLD
jgi:hypothetical protein